LTTDTADFGEETTMTVGELITFLQQFRGHEDAEIYIDLPSKRLVKLVGADVNPFSDPGEPFIVLKFDA
jgi:hypothetical protein